MAVKVGANTNTKHKTQISFVHKKNNKNTNKFCSQKKHKTQQKAILRLINLAH